MTSSESQPRTQAGRALLGHVDHHFEWTGEGENTYRDAWVRGILQVEAEAAAGPPASPVLNVERLAAALRSADLSMRSDTGRVRNRTPIYWRDMAELLFVLIPALAGAEAAD